MLPINRWLKIAILVAAPCILFWLIVEQMSWKRPQPFAPTSGVVYTLAFSPDGKRLASGALKKKYLYSSTGSVNTIQIWDVSSQNVVKTLKQSDILGKLLFMPGGEVLACADITNRGGSMRLYDLKTGKLLLTLARGSYRLALSPDGKMLASQRDSERNTIELWDVEAQQLRTVLADTEKVYSSAFSPDGRLLATTTFSGREYSMDLWDVPTGRKVGTLPDSIHYCDNLTFSPDGQMLAGIAYDKVKIWDVNTTSSPRVVAGAAQRLSAIAFSPDSSLLAIGTTENSVHLRTAGTGELLRTMKMQPFPQIGIVTPAGVSAMAFSPDGSTLACGGDKGKINLWRIK